MQNKALHVVVTVAGCVSAIAIFSLLLVSVGRESNSIPIRNLTTRQTQQQQQHQLARYNQGTIEDAYPDMIKFEPLLLVFDGQRFQAYSMVGTLSFRYTFVVPLLVHALRSNHPDRFNAGQPQFQMVFTTADYLISDCVSKPCPQAREFPPIASFSTAHRDETILPTAKNFPNPPYTQRCLYHYIINGDINCRDWHAVDQSLSWEELVPTITWRGSDFHRFLDTLPEYSSTKFPWMNGVFTKGSLHAMTATQTIDALFEHYNELTPRWRAAALTLRAKLDATSNAKQHRHPWIDCMFTGHIHKEIHDLFAEKGLQVSTSEKMNAVAMSRFQYQIDLGGGGGTTWEGTLTKLRMPGVLFHHETPTKDWFYDMMEPWKHYIPVQADIADLWEKYQWAVHHPDETKRIAQESTKLAEYLLSGEYMEQLYNDLFGSWLGQVVEAYEPMDGISWEESLKRYSERGIPLRLVSDCNDVTCNTQWGEGKFVDAYPHVAQVH